jgi:hypothetical protein
MKPPNPPRRDCKKADRWKAYYSEMALWNQGIADSLKQDYPSAASDADAEAQRFREGVAEIENRTHHCILSGEWK